MAIQVDLKDVTMGGPAPTAYVRINSFYRIDNVLHVHLGIHASAEARSSSQQPIWAGDKLCTIPTDMAEYGDDMAGIFSKLYVWLKTLPEFAGAIDIIEPEPVVTDPPPDAAVPPTDPVVPAA
jgi:hypothetical protein